MLSIPHVAYALGVKCFKCVIPAMVVRHNSKGKWKNYTYLERLIKQPMNLSHIPYPSYKPSGVPWLGDVPEHWGVRRLKAVCRLSYGDSLPSDARCDGAISVYGSNGPVGMHTTANTEAPCIVVGRKGSFGKIHFSTSRVFAIDTTYYVDERHSTANLAWLSRVLGWARLDEVTRDSAIPGLSREDAYNRCLPIPPLPEQAAIVRFLDHTDRRIQRYISAKQKLVGLLEEEKQAIISQAVTRGLDPNVRLKPSGVDWRAMCRSIGRCGGSGLSPASQPVVRTQSTDETVASTLSSFALRPLKE